MGDPLLLTVSEAAQVLRISRNTAYELIRQRGIPSIRLGRTIRVPRHALEAWILDQSLAGAGTDPIAAVG